MSNKIDEDYLLREIKLIKRIIPAYHFMARTARHDTTRHDSMRQRLGANGGAMFLPQLTAVHSIEEEHIISLFSLPVVIVSMVIDDGTFQRSSGTSPGTQLSSHCHAATPTPTPPAVFFQCYGRNNQTIERRTYHAPIDFCSRAL